MFSWRLVDDVVFNNTPKIEMKKKINTLVAGISICFGSK